MTAKYGKPDGNHQEIKCALECIGATVFDTKAVGKGFADLMVYRPDGLILQYEVKMPGEGLTEAERKWHTKCPAAIHIVYSAEEAVRIYTGTPGRL